MNNIIELSICKGCEYKKLMNLMPLIFDRENIVSYCWCEHYNMCKQAYERGRLQMNDLFEQSEMLRELLTTIGVAVYGKERWVEQDDDTWFDRQSGERISLYEVVDRATKAIKEDGWMI